MNGSQDEFDPSAGLGAARRGLGECPNASALAGYAADSLPPGEAAPIQAHVSVCGICDSLLESLRDFDDPVVAPSPAWAATERRLRARVFPKPRWWQWVLHPAVAYGVALAIGIVAVVAVWRPASPTVVAPSPIEMQSVRTIDLNNTRGAGVPRFTLESTDRFVVLSFQIDIRPGFRYEASLDGRTARAVGNDAAGNFAVMVSRDLLVPGSHRLRVTEIDPASGQVERPIDFAFQF